MTSAYSDLGLELMVTGENAGTWGDKTNQNLNLIQQAVAGYEQVTLSSGGTLTLAMTDATLSTARNMIIKFATATIAASTICTIPDGIEKFYIFDCSGLTNANNLTIKTVSGAGFSPTTAGAASPKIFAAYSDGTNIVEVSLNTLGGTIATAQIEAAAITTALISDNAVTTVKISDNQVTTAKISDNQITTAKISDNQITTAKISDNQVTTAKIADDAVGPDQLSNTAVTAGAYTSASITVDAQGRLTAASSGAGAATMKTMAFVTGPTSGSVALAPGASNVQAFLFAGGGGGGGAGNPGGENAHPGGSGGYGFFAASATGGSTIPYSVGGGGSAGNGSSGGGNNGSAGGATNFHNFTANAGNGGGRGRGGSPGNSGSAPGSSGTISQGILFTNDKSAAGAGGNWPQRPGSSGGAGGLWVLSNEG